MGGDRFRLTGVLARYLIESASVDGGGSRAVAAFISFSPKADRRCREVRAV